MVTNLIAEDKNMDKLIRELKKLKVNIYEIELLFDNEAFTNLFKENVKLIKDIKRSCIKLITLFNKE